ncbi:MAG: hypothetical protein LN588_04065 [Rickettsia endosymbiont of Bryobia graminum]|nr:hypothetical protein [Rickettsia endosymbiont of Bryobia graminum]
MSLLENIKKFIIIYDKNDPVLENEELRQKWVVASESFSEKILLTEIGYLGLSLDCVINSELKDNSIVHSSLSSRMYLEDNSWELAENYSPRNLALKPIQKIIYLYNNFLENISEISDLVDLSSHYVPMPQDAISIISKNSKWEDVVLIANTTIIQYLDEVLPDNINKFIIIPDVNNKGLLVEYSKEWAD